ncbi:unnamed protein product, partial [Heterotrigona itama]
AKATTVIRKIKTLEGQNNLGVEDFIRDIRNARLQCNDKYMLLKLILLEKLYNKNINDYNIRFRRGLKELKYAAQNKHKIAINRRIVIEEGNIDKQIYIINIKPEIETILMANEPATVEKSEGKTMKMEAKVKSQYRPIPEDGMASQPSISEYRHAISKSHLILGNEGVKLHTNVNLASGEGHVKEAMIESKQTM